LDYIKDLRGGSREVHLFLCPRTSSHQPIAHLFLQQTLQDAKGIMERHFEAEKFVEAQASVGKTSAEVECNENDPVESVVIEDDDRWKRAVEVARVLS
jgi:hypothetical protein